MKAKTYTEEQLTEIRARSFADGRDTGYAAGRAYVEPRADERTVIFVGDESIKATCASDKLLISKASENSTEIHRLRFELGVRMELDRNLMKELTFRRITFPYVKRD